MAGMDAVTFFYPWFSALGESLRSGHIPGWNPNQFSGTPFAADPQSGWMYLPAMVFFTLMPLVPAAAAYMVFHLLLAGVTTYALGRVLGMRVLGALVAAVAYEYSGLMYTRTPCCFNHTGVVAWLPVTILGAELAIQSRSWVKKVMWWGVSGLGISQVFAIWLGQGSYYVLLVLGGYIAYRTLLAPAESPRSVGARVGALVLHGGAVLLFAFGLAAAGLLPRLEYNAVSGLAGGYADSSASGGWSLRDWAAVLGQNSSYAGGATLALALVAPFIARWRHAVPYWTVVSIATLVLSGQGPTPLHSLLYLLPGFADLHPHLPERVMTVFYLGPAMLSGAVVSSRLEWSRRTALTFLLPVLGVLVLAATDLAVSPMSLIAAVLAIVLLATSSFFPSRRQLVAMVLLLVVFIDLSVSGRMTMSRLMQSTGWYAFRRIDLGRYYSPAGAHAFLMNLNHDQPFRYFGYDPVIGGRNRVYRSWWWDPRAQRVLANNGAMPLGLQDIQGYSPINIARYHRYFDELNTRPQGYRQAYVFSRGLNSPLLELLNTRYILLPSPELARSAHLSAVRSRYPSVYQDEWLQVLERPQALPHAWIVHSARQVWPAQALKLLRTRAVDPRQTVLLEATPPPMAQPADSTADEAIIEEYEADRLRARTRTTAPGMLVLSEVYYPAWKAYVDGRPVRVYAADHTLRAVPVPAGEHIVEMRYESTALRVGMAVSLPFYIGLTALVVLTVAKRFIHGSMRLRPAADAAPTSRLGSPG